MDSAGHLLERYLDGLLSPTERPRFESRLQQDSVVAGQIACQRRIDASLERLLVPARLDDLAAKVASATLGAAAAHSPVRARPLRLLAVAAAIALFVVGGLQLWSELLPQQRPDPYAPQPWRSVSQVYGDTVRGGFKPAWVCRNDREFETAFRRRLGQSLAIVPPPPAIAWAGVDYCNCITSSTVTVLAYAHGREVMVFADRLRQEGVAPSADAGLKVFRRELGGLVLFEVTPHDRPYLLDLFYGPDSSGP